ncbi:S1C family serine protease [Entomobacter blattae]|uniref:S1C family serine protease n=1 Tax=Entomobacter blattae TaxID=2762277 RepID=UPI0038CF496A
MTHNLFGDSSPIAHKNTCPPQTHKMRSFPFLAQSLSFSSLPFLGLLWFSAVPIASAWAQNPSPNSAPPLSSAPSSSAPSEAENSKSQDKGQDIVISRPLSFAPIVKKVAPSVVNIAVTEDLNNPHQKRHVLPSVRGTPYEKKFRERMRKHNEETLGAGSGFIIDSTGFIATNSHVVGNADKITVSLSDGTSFPAKVIGVDILTDIAVIKITSPHALPAITWGDSRKIQVGDWIIAAGNPFGLGSSVTAGIVSARGRDIGSSPFDDFLQLDAPINPGNSGGPSFNIAGEVVALNTAIVSPTGSSVGVGFGIPSETAQPIVDELRKNGHIDRGWLGITLENSTNHDGVRIIGVDKNGPAQKAGLQKNDIVISLKGEHVETARGLIRSIAAIHPQSTVNIEIKRKNKTFTLSLTIGYRPIEIDN